MFRGSKDPMNRHAAVMYSKKALEIEPKHQFSRDVVDGIINPLYQEAHEHRLWGRFEEAIKGYEEVLFFDPKHLHATAELGYTNRVLWERDKNPLNLTNAMVYSQMALGINPDHQFSKDVLNGLPK